MYVYACVYLSIYIYIYIYTNTYIDIKLITTSAMPGSTWQPGPRLGQYIEHYISTA